MGISENSNKLIGEMLKDVLKDFYKDYPVELKEVGNQFKSLTGSLVNEIKKLL